MDCPKGTFFDGTRCQAGAGHVCRSGNLYKEEKENNVEDNNKSFKLSPLKKIPKEEKVDQVSFTEIPVKPVYTDNMNQGNEEEFNEINTGEDLNILEETVSPKSKIFKI